MHRRLGSATLFRGENNPNFPMGEIPMGIHNCKITINKTKVTGRWVLWRYFNTNKQIGTHLISPLHLVVGNPLTDPLV